MGFRAELIKHIKFNELDATQRAELKKKFDEHKRDLKIALRAVDQGLKSLATAAKRPTKR